MREKIQDLKSIVSILNEGKSDKGYYIGFKDTDVIPLDYFSSLKEKGFYLHTIDKMAKGGRAIDIDLLNPITARAMTGSSSGTAINVFLGVNDIGIGTDGGGSVLGPAASLNLYGFISKLICQEQMKKHTKKSTDGIEFYPSIGYICKSLRPIKELVDLTIDLKDEYKDYKLKVASPKNNYHEDAKAIIDNIDYQEVDLSYDGLDRRRMIEELSNFDFDNNILITFEGPVDLFGYGDSIIGHYGSYAKDIQEKGYKYYLKVVNMLGLSALIVPTKYLSMGILIIGKSEDSAIREIFRIAEQINFKRSTLEENYFSV